LIAQILPLRSTASVATPSWAGEADDVGPALGSIRHRRLWFCRSVDRCREPPRGSTPKLVTFDRKAARLPGHLPFQFETRNVRACSRLRVYPSSRVFESLASFVLCFSASSASSVRCHPPLGGHRLERLGRVSRGGGSRDPACVRGPVLRRSHDPPCSAHSRARDGLGAGFKPRLDLGNLALASFSGSDQSHFVGSQSAAPPKGGGESPFAPPPRAGGGFLGGGGGGAPGPHSPPGTAHRQHRQLPTSAHRLAGKADRPLTNACQAEDAAAELDQRQREFEKLPSPCSWRDRGRGCKCCRELQERAVTGRARRSPRYRQAGEADILPGSSRTIWTGT